jgi:hypothetical protein
LPHSSCVGVVDTVDNTAWAYRFRQTVMQSAFGRNYYILNWAAPAPQVPDLHTTVTTRSC